ncbi:hypothetical protein AGMMS49546_36880 [Spirochaetia bacterium]|nr:hypothetical protein AGMMS49546_36880 [Spirochaetia bacterium]
MFKDQVVAVLDGSNREKMVHFYRDIMRYPVIDEGKGGGDLIFAAGKTGRVKISAEPLPYAVGPMAMWIEASYVDDVYAEIVKGGELEYHVPPKTSYYHARPSYVGDPNGNTICVINYEKDLETRKAAGIAKGWYAEESRAVFYLKNIALCDEFYTTVLGLKKVYEWKENLGDRGFKYELCEGSRSYIEILLREPFVRLRLGMVEIFAKDIEGLYKSVSAKPKVEILKPLAGNGSNRSFTLADPDGNIIRIYSYVK